MHCSSHDQTFSTSFLALYGIHLLISIYIPIYSTSPLIYANKWSGHHLSSLLPGRGHPSLERWSAWLSCWQLDLDLESTGRQAGGHICEGVSWLGYRKWEELPRIQVAPSADDTGKGTLEQRLCFLPVAVQFLPHSFPKIRTSFSQLQHGWTGDQYLPRNPWGF